MLNWKSNRKTYHAFLDQKNKRKLLLELRLAEISYSSYVDQFYLFPQKISYSRVILSCLSELLVRNFTVKFFKVVILKISLLYIIFLSSLFYIYNMPYTYIYIYNHYIILFYFTYIVYYIERHIYTYTHTHIYTYTHIHIHTYISNVKQSIISLRQFHY